MFAVMKKINKNEYKKILEELERLCNHNYKTYYIKDILIHECTKCKHKIKHIKGFKEYCEKIYKQLHLLITISNIPIED